MAPPAPESRSYSFPLFCLARYRISIHQIDIIGQDTAFATSLVVVLQGHPVIVTPQAAALSDKFFLYASVTRYSATTLSAKEGIIGLRLRQYSPGPNHSSKYVVEHPVGAQLVHVRSTFILPGDRAVLVASKFIHVYAIISQEDSTPPKLVLLHRVLVASSEPFFAPFIGSQCTYVIGIYKDTLRTITISYDRALPLTTPWKSRTTPNDGISSYKYGPSASVIQRSQTSLGFITYGYSIGSTCFPRKKYDLPNNDSNSITRLVGFDDSMGRIVLESGPAHDDFLVLDLI